MADPVETIWPLEPHTGAKHQILGRYLDAWFPILAKYNNKLIYVDGFAGPGCYAGGEPGSPIVALKSAMSHKLKISLEFWLIERRADRRDRLQAEIDRINVPNNFTVRPKLGTFAKTFTDELDGSNHEAPTFVLVDPFGFSGIPYDLIKRVLDRPKCEVLITFMVDAINRWLAEENVRDHILETFGTTEALDIAFGRGDRVTELKSLYLRQLQKIARFVRYFEMRDIKNRVVYYLFFATNNRLGHVKMKESMWKAAPQGDFRFSDATDPNQLVMFTAPTTTGLADELARHFKGKPQMDVGQIQLYVEDETAYLEKHMRAALKLLASEPDPRLIVAPYKSDGQKRKAGTFPPGTLVRFPQASR